MTEQIELVFLNREEMPLFYVEGGTRLYGTKEPGERRDVRGFHMISRNQYFDFHAHPAIIETRYENFDFLSYNLDKMFLMLSNSNPTAVEWIRAPEIYLNRVPDWEIFRAEVLANIDLKPLYYHHLAIAKTNVRLLQNGRETNWWTVIKTVRGLLSAGLAAGDMLPEVSLHDLFTRYEPGNELVKVGIEALVACDSEKKLSPAKQDAVLNVLEAYTSKLETITLQGVHKNRNSLEKVLQEYCYQLKATYYCNW